MVGDPAFTYLLSGEIHTRAAVSDDETVASLALRQEGIVGRRQLLDLRLGGDAIDHRLAAGRLRLQYPGVYAVGHEALSFSAHALAAVMAIRWIRPGGDQVRAAASHWTAVALCGLREPPDGPIHVTATRSRARRPGIVTHRALLPPEEIAIVDGMPVTSVERTLLDLSAITPERRLRRLVKESEFQGLTNPVALGTILARYPRRRGRGNLAAIVGGHLLHAGRTRSEFEDAFLLFCAERRLPLPETNVVLDVGGRQFEVDCLWRHARLIVELDGRTAHGTTSAFQDDRARDRVLIAAGWSPMRVTWAHLHQQPDTLEREIRDALVIHTAHGRGFAPVEGG